MRAARWFSGLCLLIGLAAAADAQQAVTFNGSFSGQPTRNVSLDTSRLATPLPPVPSRPGKSRLFNLLPSVGSLLNPTGLKKTQNPFQPLVIK